MRHPDTRRTDVMGAVAIAGITALTSAVGAVSGDFGSAWYRSLRKPPWQPSGAVIGAVWTVLYALTAISGSLLWRHRDDRRARGLAALFGVQYALNGAFTPLLTRARSLPLATVDSAVLLGTVVAMIVRAWRVRRLAALLLVPYAAWTAFATYLSWRLTQLNHFDRSAA